MIFSYKSNTSHYDRTHFVKKNIPIIVSVDFGLVIALEILVPWINACYNQSRGKGLVLLRILIIET